ncbi:MAG: hypothetical protein QOH57_3953 [Mycobacterium sp.]|jgi:hypothetical protein|nr:hypothetical protein [Mycobacterium sp.]
MRKASTLAAAAVALGVIAAPAGLASADQQSAQGTIDFWQQQGYKVNVDRVGSGPLQDCVVTGVRNPNTITRLVRVNSRGPGRSYLVPVIVSKTVSVSLDCSK